MDLNYSNATLAHHWMFNETMDDYVGNADFKYSNTSVLDYTKYTANKDEVRGQALDNSVGTKTYWTDYVESFHYKHTISAWVKRPNRPNFEGTQALCFNEISAAGFGLEEGGLSVNAIGMLSILYKYPDFVKKGDWFHLLIAREIVHAEYHLKIYINNFLYKDVVENHPSPNYAGEMVPSQTRIGLNCNALNGELYHAGNNVDLDEIKIFRGWLDDGGISVGEYAKNEVFDLYTSGVSLIPKPTGIKVSGVTKSSAILSWS